MCSAGMKRTVLHSGQSRYCGEPEKLSPTMSSQRPHCNGDPDGLNNLWQRGTGQGTVQGPSPHPLFKTPNNYEQTQTFTVQQRRRKGNNNTRAASAVRPPPSNFSRGQMTPTRRRPRVTSRKGEGRNQRGRGASSKVISPPSRPLRPRRRRRRRRRRHRAASKTVALPPPLLHCT